MSNILYYMQYYAKIIVIIKKQCFVMINNKFMFGNINIRTKGKLNRLYKNDLITCSNKNFLFTSLISFNRN